MNDSSLPEEKLLKLIKGGKKAEPAGDGVTSAPPDRRGALRSFTRKPFRLTARRLVAVSFLVSCVYFLFAFASTWIRFPERQEAAQVVVEDPERKEAGATVRPWEDYQGVTQGKSLFGAAAPSAVGQPVAQLATDVLQDFSLIGVITGEDAQAIIQDKKNGKSYYLRKGQSLEGFQLQDIQEGKIVLIQNGESFELYL